MVPFFAWLTGIGVPMLTLLPARLVGAVLIRRSAGYGWSAFLTAWEMIVIIVAEPRRHANPVVAAVAALLLAVVEIAVWLARPAHANLPPTSGRADHAPASGA